MRRQRTLKDSVILEGKGIHSGDDIRVKIRSAPVDTGIIFVRSDLDGKPAVAAAVSNLADCSGGSRCSVIKKGAAEVSTIEHLMAALSGMGIDNAEIEIDNRELPALDGSALDYVKKLEEAGSAEQGRDKKRLVLNNAVYSSDNGGLITAIPSESFGVSYFFQYEGPGGMRQWAHFYFDSENDRKSEFVKNIAPARTFCMAGEVAHILNKGLGRGASYENALVIKDGLPVENKFRFENEPARHKILDILGDLSLLNADLKAHVVGIRSGHFLNAGLLRELEKLL